jgi:hypothetical protein
MTTSLMIEVVPSLFASDPPIFLAVTRNLGESLAQFSWIGYLLIAWLLFTSGRVSRLFCMGLLLLAFGGLAWHLAIQQEAEAATIESLRAITSFTYPGAVILMILGALGTLGMRGAVQNELMSLGNDPSLDQSSLVVQRSADSTLALAVELRDSIYAMLEEECARDRVKVIAYRSEPHHPDVWLKFEYSMPQPTPDVTLRAGILIRIECFDFHRFEHILNVEVTHAGEKWVVTGLHTLTDKAIHKLHRCALRGRKLTQMFDPLLPEELRIRQNPLQFWRPENRINRLRPDWVKYCSLGGLAVLLIIPRVGVILAALGFVAFLVTQLRKKQHVLSAGKPLLDPRILVRMDSWQASLEGLGGLAEETRQELLAKLTASSKGRVQIQAEHIWHMGVDGKVERQQVVVAFRRAYGFLHIEPYGDDLYIGWDTHLNAGTWKEKSIAHGVDRRSGKKVVANRVVAAVQPLTEYDVTDVSFLTEWLHTTTMRLVKVKLAHYQIDQEIDFTVQRESRKDALAKPEGTKEKAGEGRKLFHAKRVN